MKQLFKLYLVALATLLTYQANAQISITDNGLKISDIRTEQINNRMDVSMTVDMSQMRVKSNHSLRVTPYLTDGKEIVQMPAIIIDGRRRSIVHQRLSDEQFPSSDIYVRRHNRETESLNYEYNLPYESWMQSAEFALREEWCACHDIPYSEDIITIAETSAVTPTKAADVMDIIPQLKMAYAIPKEESEPMASTTMNIYFPVNKSQINLDFMGNKETSELIKKAMESNNIEAIKLMGYASPEGPYAFNSNLAQKRAEQTNKYLVDNNLTKITSTITSAPINWAGLREMLLKSYISNYLKIVEIIDSNEIKPQDKNRIIKERYPVEYKFMLRTWYPKLRTTAITIDHKVKPKSINEAKATLNTNPSALSLADIYLIALSYEKGSKEWNDMIILAVENFPNINEARVNAANVAMANGDYNKAESYLNGVPQNMPEAMNSRGILAMANGNYAEAQKLFEEAQKAGVSEARYNLSLLKELTVTEQ